MTDDLHLSGELISQLEGLAIKTSAGSFVKMEDVRRLIEKRQEAGAIQDEEAPKSMDQAREQAKRFLAKQEGLDLTKPREPGRSLPASEPQPSSRT